MAAYTGRRDNQNTAAGLLMRTVLETRRWRCQRYGWDACTNRQNIRSLNQQMRNGKAELTAVPWYARGHPIWL